MLKLNIVSVFIFILILIFSETVTAQKNIEFSVRNFTDNKKDLTNALTDIENGDIYFKISPGAYRIALKFYLRANSFNPNNAELNYKIGRCYLHSDSKNKATEFLKKSIYLKANNKYHAKYYLALSYHFEGKFEKAIKTYKDYLNSTAKKDKKEYQKLTDRRILESEKALNLYRNPVVQDVINLGPNVNSIYADYSPVLSTNGEKLFFTSRRKSGYIEKNAYDSTDFQYFENTYSSIKDSNEWKNIKNTSSNNNHAFHNAVIYKTGSVEILYRAENSGDLYIKHKNEDAKPFPETINSEYSETSAVLSADGKTLYFISNRKKNNFGGKDIYYSELDTDGNWKEAVNIGDVINSEYDEDGLYMHHKDNILFFSSKQEGTIGGYDIFKTTKFDSVWSKPVNVGYPINTPANDIHFTISPDCKTIYFASDREGGQGMHDIYSCELNDKILQSNYIKGTVTDIKENIPLEAFIKVFDENENEILSVKTNPKNGNFSGLIPVGDNHTIIVNSKDYLFFSEKFDVSETSMCFFTIHKNIKLTKAVKGNKIILAAVEFDFASAHLRESSYPALNSIAAYILKNPKMKIEIGGHTDNKGTQNYNLKLSENRAKAIVDYLKTKKVPSNQISYKGYSYTKPIASNDTEEGQQKNRRVEFTIIEK